ncbi:bifunctional aminoglycoside phosphotransferase/ATP-binding protein [Maliponia aquimaris]|uniref:Uncharacterized protein n=1 Tax=Maliponia aquimaris TaxID=1673631 RepID=A0A238L1C6_9RHOB|nr:bifunctional aminoglycoside phosphotransferase/ATP-binding protein [Maliponia aquimaris]SMX48819.1 hypothetical protein MAA8898_04120 [Maliponia aquimaris]
MGEQSQAEVIAFLSERSNLPGHAPVEVIRTHAAVVFLSGKDAYKIKRDVRYDYLDFSTLQKRHDMLLRELELNVPMAPAIYRDVIAVTRDSAGDLHLGGSGEVVEWVLRMHRFDAEDELEQIAARGALDDPMAMLLGRGVAEYHATNTPRSDIAGSDLINAILDELNTVFATIAADLGAHRVARFRAASDRVFRTVQTTLDTRGQSGHVRRCHGDLHLRNIVLVDGVPTPFDALEFDETLGTCDVLYDLAFLLMDLCHMGLKRAANIVLNSYLHHARSMDHHAALSLLPLFLSIRAAIRAMVVAQTASFNPDDDTLTDEARSYLSSALAYLGPEPAQLIAIGGLSGTGKTVLATSLAHHIGAAPGAVHLRSDLERKALFDVSPQTRLPASAYQPQVSARVHAILLEKARLVLSGGHSVILDATWMDEDARAMLPALAGKFGARFTGVWLTAELGGLESRVSTRRGDASDADVAVVRGQAARITAPISWPRIDASGSPEDTFLKVQTLLFGPERQDPPGQESRGPRHA